MGTKRSEQKKIIYFMGVGKLNANKIYADLKTGIPNIKLRSLTLGVFIGMSVAYFTDLAIPRGLFTLVIAMLLWITSKNA